MKIMTHREIIDCDNYISEIVADRNRLAAQLATVTAERDAALALAKPLVWTSELPTVQGAYVYCPITQNPASEYSMSLMSAPTVRIITSDPELLRYEGFMWYGPIPPLLESEPTT